MTRAVDLTLRQTTNSVIRTVRDDGVGFDPYGSFPGYLDRRPMCERTANLGGSLQIESTPAAAPTSSPTFPPLHPTVRGCPCFSQAMPQTPALR